MASAGADDLQVVQCSRSKPSLSAVPAAAAQAPVSNTMLTHTGQQQQAVNALQPPTPAVALPRHPKQHMPAPSATPASVHSLQQVQAAAAAAAAAAVSSSSAKRKQSQQAAPQLSDLCIFLHG